MAEKYLWIKQATKSGWIKMKSGGVCDVSYPTSKLRRGRVQGGGDVSPTLTCESGGIVKIDMEDKKNMDAIKTEKTQEELDELVETITKPKYRIRKLTPKETWRLMNFSDEDFYKAQSVNSNSQLYKEAGNSICCNVLCAIFSQLGIQGHKKWNEMTLEERRALVYKGTVLEAK